MLVLIKKNLHEKKLRIQRFEMGKIVISYKV